MQHDIGTLEHWNIFKQWNLKVDVTCDYPTTKGLTYSLSGQSAKEKPPLPEVFNVVYGIWYINEYECKCGYE